jgi:hypothetical protein
LVWVCSEFAKFAATLALAKYLSQLDVSIKDVSIFYRWWDHLTSCNFNCATTRSRKRPSLCAFFSYREGLSLVSITGIHSIGSISRTLLIGHGGLL